MQLLCQLHGAEFLCLMTWTVTKSLTNRSSERILYRGIQSQRHDIVNLNDSPAERKMLLVAFNFYEINLHHTFAHYFLWQTFRLIDLVHRTKLNIYITRVSG